MFARHRLAAAAAAWFAVLCVAPVALAANTVAGQDLGREQGRGPSAKAHGHARGLVPRVRRGQKATFTSANPYCTRCSPPLLFTRGEPVAGGLTGTPGQITITPVYWAPASYGFAAGYKAIVNGYLQNVASASGHDSNAFSVATQYYQQALSAGSPVAHIHYTVSVGAEVDDANSFPAQSSLVGCVADPGFTACVDDAALLGELQTELARLGRPISDSNIYTVFFPPAVETCIGSGVASTTNDCSTNAYCAYHSDSSAAPHLVYSNQPYPDVNHCSDPVNGPQAPNGDPYADDQVSLVSHEANEAITDWSGAWMDSSGYENGDECAYVYGQPLGSRAGAQTLYNQAIGGGKYYTQDEFSNEDFAMGRGDRTTTGGPLVPGCIQREEPPVASIKTSGSFTAGATLDFDASASSDPDGAGGALTYLWSWGDGSPNGTGAVATHVFHTAGTYNVTVVVTDGDGWSATQVQSMIVASGRTVAPAQAVATAPSIRQTVPQSSPAPSPRPR